MSEKDTNIEIPVKRIKRIHPLQKPNIKLCIASFTVIMPTSAAILMFFVRIFQF